jgi:hypothetical protein
MPKTLSKPLGVLISLADRIAAGPSSPCRVLWGVFSWPQLRRHRRVDVRAAPVGANINKLADFRLHM